jgi:hypothetical protein
MKKLSARFEVAEMIEALVSLKTGKVAGPNGLPGGLYSAYALGWAWLLTAQANACLLAHSPLSELQRWGHIAQLFKKGLLSMCEHYRPVATLNKN